MFFRRKETQRLLEARTQSLARAEERIKDLTDANKWLNEARKEANEVITTIEKVLYSGMSNEKIIRKIKELVSDCESIN